MTQVEDIEQWMIFLSEFYSDNKIKMQVYHRPFVILEKDELIKTLYSNNEIDAENFARSLLNE